MEEKKEILETLLRLAEETTSQRLNDFDQALALIDEFTKHIKTDPKTFVIGVKNGCYGKYGTAYSLTPQLICSWVYRYIQEKDKDQSGML